MAVIVDIDHEAGNLSEYTATVTDSGDLSVSAAAALAGSDYGLQCVVDDLTQIYGYVALGSANTSGVIRARLYIDPNGLTMGTDASTTYFYASRGDATTIGSMQIVYSGEVYNLRAVIVSDDTTAHHTGLCEITDAPHYIEIRITRATNSSSNDGHLEWWVDGVEQTAITSIDNYDRFSSFQLAIMGYVVGVASISGTFYLDELKVNDDGSEIGPVPTTTTLTVQDAAHSHTVDSPALTQAHNLAIQDASHSHTADGVVLLQVHNLVVADASHAHAAETPALTQDHTLAVQDAAHAHNAETPALTQLHLLVVADAQHAHSSDAVILAQVHVLIVEDAQHAHSADNVELSSSIFLVVADGLHSHTADNPALTQVHQLSLADTEHAHTADAVQLTQIHSLAVEDAQHGHQVDNVVLDITGYTLEVANGHHGHTADNVELTQVHELSVNDATHGHLASHVMLSLILSINAGREINPESLIYDRLRGRGKRAVNIYNNWRGRK